MTASSPASRLCLALALALLSGAVVLAESPAVPGKPAGSRWNFQLIPKAFQGNPQLEMTVLTELTAEGKKRPAASPQSPVYYVAHPGGYHTAGESTPPHPMTATEVEPLLRRALAAGGFQPASPGHPPQLLIVYLWGAHNFVSSETAEVSPDVAIGNILERAALVGGDKFAGELSHAIADRNLLASASAPPLGRGGDPDSMDLGAAAGLAQMSDVMDPVKLFRERSPKTQFLFDQAASDCYYVVASAYDYASSATPNKQLLWRTRMSVNADGVGQLDAVPGVLAAAAPYFGREMPEPATLRKRMLRDAQVEIGELNVVEDEKAAPPAAGEKPPPPVR